MEPKGASFHFIAIAFIVDFAINGMQGEPVAVFVEHVIKRTKKSAGLSIEDIISSRWDWPLIGNTCGSSTIDVLTVSRESSKRCCPVLEDPVNNSV